MRRCALSSRSCHVVICFPNCAAAQKGMLLLRQTQTWTCASSVHSLPCLSLNLSTEHMVDCQPLLLIYSQG